MIFNIQIYKIGENYYRLVVDKPWVRKIPCRRAWQPTPVCLPGESHGQRILAGGSLQGCPESDMTEVTKQQQQHTNQTKPKT